MRLAVTSGFSLTPTPLFLAQAEVPGETFPINIRVAAFVHKAELERGYLEQLDLLPLNRWSTATEDGRAGFLQTLSSSASLAVIEGATFTTSTLGLLDGVALRRIDSGSASSQLSDLPAEVVAVWSRLEDPFGRDYQLLIPDAGEPYAFWAVHEATGSVIGVLPDGSGGATREELEANLKATNKLLDVIGKVGSLFGASTGVWVALEQTKAALVTKATIVLATGEDPGGWEDPLAKLLCGQLRSQIGNQIPAAKTYFDAVSRINDVGGASGMDSIPATPGCP